MINDGEHLSLDNIKEHLLLIENIPEDTYIKPLEEIFDRKEYIEWIKDNEYQARLDSSIYITPLTVRRFQDSDTTPPGGIAQSRITEADAAGFAVRLWER